jgi:asparagine synthase (glutamine-hydrolysing)
MPSALVAADAFRRDGLATLWSPLLGDVARRTRKSVWAVLAEVARALRGRTPPLMRTFPLVSAPIAAAATGAVHAWVTRAREAGVTPAKALQIEALANCQMFNSDSRSHREADLVYPLLAQPVVELCLSIGAPELAGGAFDRAFTRRAFADRLPEAVRLRRTKGVMGSFFTHLVADSLEVMRPYLLDGCLCDAGVLDRAEVERLLDVRQLIWTSSATEILWAVTIEAWVRYWQGRMPDSPAASRRMLASID